MDTTPGMAGVPGISTGNQRESQDAEAVGEAEGGNEEADLLGVRQACWGDPRGRATRNPGSAVERIQGDGDRGVVSTAMSELRTTDRDSLPTAKQGTVQ